MSDPLLGIGIDQFEIGGYVPTGFRIISPADMTGVTFNLYDSSNQLIPSTSVTYPNLAQGTPFAFSGLEDNSTYYFQAIGPTTNSYKYQIITGPTSPSVTSFPNLIIITDQNSPDLKITQSSFDVSWDEAINSNGDSMTYSLRVTYQPTSTTPPQTAIISLTDQNQTITTLQTRNQVIDGVTNSITDVVSGGVGYECTIIGTLNGTTFEGNTINIETFPLDVTNVTMTYPYLYFSHNQPLSTDYKFLLLNPDGSDTGISFVVATDVSPTEEYPYRRVVDLTNLNSFYPQLAGNTSYKIKLFTRSPRVGYNTSPGVLIQQEPFLTLPSAVTDLVASDITSSQASVSWTSPEETGVSYSLQFLDSSNTLISDLGSQTSPYNFTGLTKNTTYNVNVIATNATGNTTSSTSFTTSPTIASITSVDSITSDGCDLNLADFGEEGLTYNIFTTDSTGTIIALVQTPTASPTTITGLLSNTLYYLIIRTTNAFGGLYDSSPVSFTTLPLASITSVDTITQSGCRVNTTSQESGVTYTIIASVNSDGSSPAKTITATSSSQTLSGLSANTSYYLFITATNTSGSTTSSSFSLLTLPNTPTSLSVSNIGTTSCNVTWAAGDSDVSFNIIQLSNDDGTTEINSLAYNATSPYSLSELTSNSLYTIAISASNASGSVQSSTTAFTTLVLKSISASFSHVAKAINTNVDVTITLRNDGGSINTTEDPSTITVSDGTSDFPVTYSQANGYVCVLNSATVGAVTYTITSTNFGSTSGSITWNNGGGGGGSGGGGENNGGNEHNNMAALYWQDDSLAAAVSQTTEITLAGETQTAPLVLDQTIVVPASLSGLISYSGAYTSELKDNKLTVTYPTVTVDISALMTAAAAIDLEFQDVEHDKLTSSSNTGVDTLQGLFKNSQWEYAAGGMFGLNLPIEATVKVENKTLFCPDLDTIFTTPAASSAASSYPVLLFEEALAAGKFTGATLNGDDAAGSATFASGDSFSVYVTYTLTKTRKFLLDDAQGSGSASIRVGDVTISPAGREETATPIPHVIEWRFVHP